MECLGSETSLAKCNHFCMPPVQNQLVEKNEGYGRTINKFLDIGIRPYFRRKKKRKFDKQKFGSALIELFDDGKKPKIRLDNEVRIEIEFKNLKSNLRMLGKKFQLI